MRKLALGSATFVGLLVALAAAAPGCGSGANPIEQEQLDRSRGSWSTAKQSGSVYRYVDTATSFTGNSSATTIEVNNDAVVRRTFSSEDSSGNVLESWTEEGATLGTHAQGKPPLTMEQVYDYCEDTVLSKSPADNLITLVLRADGLLSVCSYFPKNCADDCAVGYYLTSIEFFD
jgi:hypothetical protein